MRFFLALTVAALSATATAKPAPMLAAFGQTIIVDGPRVKPLKLLEDSRCPINARCIWAGRARVRVAIFAAQKWTQRDLTMGEGVQVADGTLTLATVLPDKIAGPKQRLSDYRFGFTFSGGL